MDYQVTNEQGDTGNPTRNLPLDSDYLITWINQGLEQAPEICIYGNPEGLRRLARNLLHVADLNQADNETLQGDDSFHCHLQTGLNCEAVDSLPRLTIGRADSIDDDSELRNCFPPLVPEFSDCSIVELDDSENNGQ